MEIKYFKFNLHLIPDLDRQQLSEALKVAYQKGWLEDYTPPKPKAASKKKTKQITDEDEKRFEIFWKTFNYKKGKANARDAWMNIEMDDELFERIIKAAMREASNRWEIEKKGSTPIWAQGWLNQKRWIDYDAASPVAVGIATDQEPEGWKEYFIEYSGKEPEMSWHQLSQSTKNEIKEGMKS